MNDIDIIYGKKKQEYRLGVETAYVFRDYDSERNYLKNCLKAFEKYMDDKGLKKDRPYSLFMWGSCKNMKAKSIEELYINFKIFVDGFCIQERY